MRIASEGTTWVAFIAASSEFGRHLPPKFPPQQMPPNFPGAGSHHTTPLPHGDSGPGFYRPMPRPHVDDGFNVSTMGRTPDGRIALMIEAASHHGDVVVTESSDGHVTITDSRGQSYTFSVSADGPAVSSDAQVLVGGEALDTMAPGTLAGADGLQEPLSGEPNARGSTLIGDPANDQLRPPGSDAYANAGRVGAHPEAALRGDMPVAAIQGHSAWNSRPRSKAWRSRRRLLRWLRRLRVLPRLR
jgi:hypothetical protein